VAKCFFSRANRSFPNGLKPSFSQGWGEVSVVVASSAGREGGLTGNHACAINNRGQVVGHSDWPNDATSHGFLWTTEMRSMLDLDTLPGDFASLTLGINDGGVVVGASWFGVH
jgi:probable HAF family extracellular repeat protein